MNIVVLAGGLSPERDVSLSSGVMAANALMECGHKVVLVDLFFGAEELAKDPAAAFAAAKPLARRTISTVAPDLDAIRKERRTGLSPDIGCGVVELCKAADITYLALHGADGENGRLQAFLDLHGIRYTGSPSFGCALAMHKWVTKQLFFGADIPTPRGLLLKKGAPVSEFPLPCVVKPCCGGSSIGVALPDTREELETALRDILQYGNRVIVEEKIQGRELTQLVLGDHYLSTIEIVPPEGMTFDYVAKYQSGALAAQEICPAPITEAEHKLIGEAALKLHRALGLSVYSRTDFILDKEGRAWCLEVNTLPGMTPNSLIPKAAAVAGISYGELCEKIVLLSLAEKNKR